MSVWSNNVSSLDERILELDGTPEKRPQEYMVSMCATDLALP